MNNRFKRYWFCFILVITLVGCSAPKDSKVSLIAEADLYVFEAEPDQSEVNVAEHLLSAGVGRGRKEGRLISYLRFDLSKLPTSTAFYDVVIDSAELRLLAQSVGLAGEDSRFFVRVSYCSESEWLESTLTWNSRVCKNELEGQDSSIVDGRGFPQIYTWNVTRGVISNRERGDVKSTFVIDGFRLEVAPGAREIVPGERFGGEEKVGFVRFWSRERLQFGVNAVPTLSVSQSTHPTALLNFLSSTVSVLSAIGAAAGLYATIKRVRSGRKT